ncbi:MAG: hypothetical protein PHG24_01645 [Candidatus Pacebacteria bacterium]|nr:hypothetical protein [Candidatus Paceibacterota bacterium]
MDSFVLNTVHQIADCKIEDYYKLRNILVGNKDIPKEVVSAALLKTYRRRISREKVNSTNSFCLLSAMTHFATPECSSLLEELLYNPILLETKCRSIRCAIIEMTGKVGNREAIIALKNFQGKARRIKYTKEITTKIVSIGLFDEKVIRTLSPQDLLDLDAACINKALLNYSARNST